MNPPVWLRRTVFAIFLVLTAKVQADKPRLQIMQNAQPAHSELQLAYQHLQAKSLAAAEASYRKVLQHDPNHPDALLALAALAAFQGQFDTANDFAERALTAAPLDCAIQASRLNRPSQLPTTNESRLKLLIEQNPRCAALHFAMGNLQARQQHWPEAQAAYFNAVAGDAGNPDYLFNLAVSLEHLKQPQLASQHYRRALAAARTRPAAFQEQALEQHLQALTP